MSKCYKWLQDKRRQMLFYCPRYLNAEGTNANGFRIFLLLFLSQLFSIFNILAFFKNGSFACILWPPLMLASSTTCSVLKESCVRMPPLHIFLGKKIIILPFSFWYLDGAKNCPRSSFITYQAVLLQTKKQPGHMAQTVENIWREHVYLLQCIRDRMPTPDIQHTLGPVKA